MHISKVARERLQASLTSLCFLFFLLIALVSPSNAQFTVTLTSVTPSTTSPTSLVQLAASGFVGAVNSSTVTVTLTPTAGLPIGPIAASSAQILPGGELVVTFAVPAGTPLAVYQPSINGQNTVPTNFSTTNPSNLTLTVIAPTLASIVPSSASQGQTLQVTINGNFTHFTGSTVANFGSGISVGGAAEGTAGPVTFETATRVTANLVISATAALGAHTVTVTTGSESVTGTFMVNPGPFTITLTSVTPSTTSPSSLVQLATSGFIGAVSPATVTVTLTPTAGSPVGPIAASAAQVLPGGELVVTFLVPAGTPLAVYRPTINGQNTVGTNFSTTNPSNLTLTVIAPTLTSIVPSSGSQGQTLQVTINGSFTHFSGSTVANFGPGISVGGAAEGTAGPVTFETATRVTANLVISATAALGAHAVTVTTGSESVTGTFTVNQSGFAVTLTSVTPSTTSPGSLVQLAASGFAGAVSPATVTVTLTPAAGSPVGPIAASSAQILPGGELVVTFVVPAGTPLAVYRPTINGQNTVGTNFSTNNPSNLTLTVVSDALRAS